jgi:hypothetical protein
VEGEPVSTASGTADVPMNGSPAVVRASSDRANMEAALRESEERFRIGINEFSIGHYGNGIG